MNRSTRRVVYWAPRLLSILFAAFLGLFAMDVLDESHGAREIAWGLLVHLIPTGLVLLVLAVSWRREWVGAIAYLGLAILYVAMFLGRFPWVTYVTISGPLLLMAGLFLINWLRRAELHSGPDRPGA